MLRVKSVPGRGSAFHIHLPCDTGTASDLAEAPDTADLPEIVPSRALLVDDEPQVREALAEALHDLGWEVTVAATGHQALAVLRDDPPPDILVADIGLPGGMNGRQLAEAAREILPCLPILLITGYAGTAIGPGDNLPAGAELLHKPFTLGVLAGRVRELMARQQR